MHLSLLFCLVSVLAHFVAAQNFLGRKTAKINATSEVLVIIDMQNDYSVAYNKEAYGYIKNPFLSEAAPPIEDVVAKQLPVINTAGVHWDMIVFSQDWLIPSIIASIGYSGPENIDNHSFCIRNTPGAEPFQQLLDAATKAQPKQIRYTKNRDNLFTELKPDPDLTNEYIELSEASPIDYPPVPSDYPNRGYDVNNTYGGKFFKDVLAELGYMKQNTKLTVMGTVTDQCVLTSVLGAVRVGYDVQVYVPGLNGGSAEPDEGWTKCTNGEPGPDACCVPLPQEIASQPSAHPMWKERAYQCQYAAGYKNALDYMQLAGATLLQTPP